MLSRENEARVNAYADWLVNNQSRKGSPEYTEVENSYKSLRARNKWQSRDLEIKRVHLWAA